jgi:glycosyltransferase involved in cell wall biosynthesis
LLRLLPHLIRFKPDVLVLTALQNYWFLLGILRLWQVALIPILTCTLWPQFRPLRPSWRILLRLNSYFFSHCVLATTVASEAIAGQIRDFASKPPPIDIFLPTYSPDQFSPIPAANAQARPFRIFFAGRIEANKGVYDILKIAERLRRDQVLSFHFDICGDGSELDSLRRRIADRGLGGVISCHGFCQREKLSSLLGQSHVVMVPTTSDFEEGFNMVCAEAVLAERPVVTSAVCPALYYVAAAAIEVAPDDADGYGDAIVRLSIDHELYESKRRACKPLQEQFYDVRNSWGARLQDVLENHLSWQFDQHANYGTGPENIRSH